MFEIKAFHNNAENAGTYCSKTFEWRWENETTTQTFCTENLNVSKRVREKQNREGIRAIYKNLRWGSINYIQYSPFVHSPLTISFLRWHSQTGDVFIALLALHLYPVNCGPVGKRDIVMIERIKCQIFTVNPNLGNTVLFGLRE